MQKALDKTKANKLKYTIKKLFRALDTDNSGLIKQEALQLLLQSHNITLAAKSMQKVCRDCKDPHSDRIVFKAALKMI